MKSFLENLLALVVGVSGCLIYLVLSALGLIVGLVILGGIINLIF